MKEQTRKEKLIGEYKATFEELSRENEGLTRKIAEVEGECVQLAQEKEEI